MKKRSAFYRTEEYILSPALGNCALPTPAPLAMQHQPPRLQFSSVKKYCLRNIRCHFKQQGARRHQSEKSERPDDDEDATVLASHTQKAQ